MIYYIKLTKLISPFLSEDMHLAKPSKTLLLVKEMLLVVTVIIPVVEPIPSRSALARMGLQ